MPDWSKVRGETECNNWSSRLGVGQQANHLLRTVKLLRITETLDTTNSELRRRTVDIPDDPEIAVVENMTLEDQSRKDVHKSITIPAVSFTTPKDTTNIGCWNVKAAQVARELNNYKCDILGLSGVIWTGSGRIKLASGESIIFSGRDDEIHREGVALLLTYVQGGKSTHGMEPSAGP